MVKVFIWCGSFRGGHQRLRSTRFLPRGFSADHTPAARRDVCGSTRDDFRPADPVYRAGNQTKEEPEMGKIAVTEFVSLDGVIEDPGGAEEYARGGWAFEIERGAEGDSFKMEEAFQSEALLLGRVTYEGFAEAWPSREGEFADKFNGMPKYVVSSTLRDPSWQNTTVLGGELPVEVARLKDAVDGEITVHGSARLAQALIAHDLVDELRLMVYPVLLGEGKRLFAPGQEKRRLRLASSKAVGDGVAVLVYEPLR
jgi:dihydrofolate reductase